MRRNIYFERPQARLKTYTVNHPAKIKSYLLTKSLVKEKEVIEKDVVHNVRASQSGYGGGSEKIR